jgi:osmotically-inducible protein OsmY
MKRTVIAMRVPLLLSLLATSFSGCSLFRSTEKAVNQIEKIEEKVTQPPPKKEEEVSHEGPLLDNKVTALRIGDALKKAGPEFDRVQVEATQEAVTMTGTVKSSADRARAEEIAKSVHRPMKLKNELRVGK